ncbi:MAG TPA: cytochrome c biogenesis protein ResB [Candidatus Paceibacterota bacterium]|nr:cytochrome c biogenesis protein ResB [Verrucomicrobiota bacterium]HSA11164.1 cytochrome c biogenesis protein ResB [Candidatus Paceibacterota bacterium]
MALDAMLDRLIRFFTSMRLTVVCLALALVLVFWGTLAQVELGLYKAQNEFFRSFIIYWSPKGAAWRVPVFPGGYLIGGVLLLNLIASQIKCFTLSVSRIGLWMVHGGLVLLLLGQLLTDLLSRESILHLRECETKNYSETQREAELAMVDTTDPNADRVVAIPQDTLARQKTIRPVGLPFTVRVKRYFANANVRERAADASESPAATKDAGLRAIVTELPRVTEMDRRDVPAAVIEIETNQGSLGTWLVSEYVDQPQGFTYDRRTYQLALRPRRHYKPYSIQLLKFTHDVYPGTEIPKNFSSRVLLHRPDTGEKREVLIYMNNPLRYAGETYYQSGFDPDNHGSILQVVRNPSWLTPYLSCVLVGLGLIVQFTVHLLGFAFQRRTA